MFVTHLLIYLLLPQSHLLNLRGFTVDNTVHELWNQCGLATGLISSSAKGSSLLCRVLTWFTWTVTIVQQPMWMQFQYTLAIAKAGSRVCISKVQTVLVPIRPEVKLWWKSGSLVAIAQKNARVQCIKYVHVVRVMDGDRTVHTLYSEVWIHCTAACLTGMLDNRCVLAYMSAEH